MFPPSMSLCAVNTAEHGDENQITTNIRFLLPTAAILEQLTKGLFRTLDSRRHETLFFPFPPQCFSHTWIYLFFSWCLPNIRLMRECLFVLKRVLLPGVQFWQGDVELSEG